MGDKAQFPFDSPIPLNPETNETFDQVQVGTPKGLADDAEEFPTLNSKFENQFHDPKVPTPMKIKSLNFQNSLDEYEIVDDMPLKTSFGHLDKSLSIKEKS